MPAPWRPQSNFEDSETIQQSSLKAIIAESLLRTGKLADPKRSMALSTSRGGSRK